MPGRTVAPESRLMTAAPAGAAPPSVTLSILLPRTTITTLCRTCEEEPSIRFAAWMAVTFSGLEVWAAPGIGQTRETINANENHEMRLVTGHLLLQTE